MASRTIASRLVRQAAGSVAAAPRALMSSQAAQPRVAEVAAAASTASFDGKDDEFFLAQLLAGIIKPRQLEDLLGDNTRAVNLRRQFVAARMRDSERSPCGDAATAMTGVPYRDMDAGALYNKVHGANCESVIGFVPIPMGVVGPLRLDDQELYVPLATTEGALVASTERGVRAITESGGATSAITADGMTRAPLVRMGSVTEAAALRRWLAQPEALIELQAAFSATSRFGRLEDIKAVNAGRNVFLRFKCFSGDAMGMNMVTKGVNACLTALGDRFEGLKVVSLSGNFCTDKKPSAVNWIEGRGKSVTVEVALSPEVLKTVLKTDAARLVELNTGKNLIGSAMAGSIGGYNAHASNLVTAVYLATGQDPAQNVESSNCMTLIEHDEDVEGGVLASVTMPSVEVGTVGGGTGLPAQAAALELLGIRGGNTERPGANAQRLASVVASTVLAGELSLMAALTTNDLVSSHMQLNRKPVEADR